MNHFNLMLTRNKKFIKEKNKNKCFADYCSSVGGHCFLICGHQFPSFWHSVCIYWNTCIYIDIDIYKIHNYNFIFENKFLDKLMFLLPFEFLSNCYFLALNYTGRKTGHRPLPR